jgi:hypothetical protein
LTAFLLNGTSQSVQIFEGMKGRLAWIAQGVLFFAIRQRLDAYDASTGAPTLRTASNSSSMIVGSVLSA